MFLIPLLCISCATLTGINEPKKWTEHEMSPQQTYHSALGSSKVPEGMDVPAMRYDINAPIKPVITPPEVLPIWIYDHVTPDGAMVVGHWIFIVLRGPEWYIQDRIVPGVNGSTPEVLLPERYEGVKK